MKYRHVFSYGYPISDGSQRWAFSFSVPGPSSADARLRGRPSGLLRAKCVSRTVETSAVFFWSAEEAAVECDFWKQAISDRFGIEIQPSFESTEDYENAFRKLHNCWPHEDVRINIELSNFIKALDEVITSSLSESPELASCLDPKKGLSGRRELFESRARKNQMESESGSEPGKYTSDDWAAIDARIQWAVKLSELQKIEEFLNGYKVTKFEAEANVNLGLVIKALNYSKNFQHPREAPHKLRPLLKRLGEDRAEFEKLHERCVETAKQLKGLFEYLSTVKAELAKGPPSKPTPNTLI